MLSDEERLKIFEEIGVDFNDYNIKPLGCGDNGCEFHTPKVGTNGGCRCLKEIRPTSLRIEITRKVRNLRARLLAAEILLEKYLKWQSDDPDRKL